MIITIFIIIIITTGSNSLPIANYNLKKIISETNYWNVGFVKWWKPD